jgi:hypothetical protein
MIAFLPLLIAAAPVGGDTVAVTRPVTRLASASVTIIQAERIAPSLAPIQASMSDRQISQREAKPIIEFY